MWGIKNCTKCEGQITPIPTAERSCGLRGTGGQWDLGQLLAKPVFSSSCLHGEKYQKIAQFALCLRLIPFESCEKPLTTRLEKEADCQQALFGAAHRSNI